MDKFDKIKQRHKKSSYKGLTPAQKRYIKLVEEEQMLEKSITSQWGIVYNLQRPPYHPDTTSPEVLELLGFIAWWEERLEKNSQKQARLLANLFEPVARRVLRRC